MWVESVIRSDKRVNCVYLRSKCTTPDIYSCDGAGLVVIRSLRTALVGLLKEDERKKMGHSI